MTYFETAINAIKEDGYGIGIEKFTTGTTVYSLMKVNNETERTIKFEVARNIAQMLIKEGAKIVYKNKNIHALNFTPQRLNKDHILIFENGTV